MAVIHPSFPYSSKVATSCIEAPSIGVNVNHIHIDALPPPRSRAVIKCDRGHTYVRRQRGLKDSRLRSDKKNLKLPRARLCPGGLGARGTTYGMSQSRDRRIGGGGG